MSAATVKPTREAKKNATREQLLSAGADLVMAHGFHGASLDAIAAEAGLTKGAVYSNFASKAEFLMEIADRVLPDLPAPNYSGDVGAALGDALVDQAHSNLGHWRRLIELVSYMASDPGLSKLQRSRRFPSGVELVPGSEAWVAAAMESAAAGLMAMRLIYGAEFISDDLIRWTIARLADETETAQPPRDARVRTKTRKAAQ